MGLNVLHTDTHRLDEPAQTPGDAFFMRDSNLEPEQLNFCKAKDETTSLLEAADCQRFPQRKKSSRLCGYPGVHKSWQQTLFEN